jgi:hypothetical protein
MLLAGMKGGRLVALAATTVGGGTAAAAAVVLALSPTQPPAAAAGVVASGTQHIDNGVRGGPDRLGVCLMAGFLWSRRGKEERERGWTSCASFDWLALYSLNRSILIDRLIDQSTFNQSTYIHTYIHMQAVSERLREALGLDAASRFSRTLYQGLVTSIDYKVNGRTDGELRRNVGFLSPY